MTSPAPSKSFCSLVLAAAIALPLLILAGVALPWASQFSAQNKVIASNTGQLERYRSLVRALPGLRAELEQTKNNSAFKAFYFNAPTAALAGAQLQGLIQEIVTGAAGRLISTQILPEDKKVDPPRVSVRMQIQGTTETLLDVLLRIDQARPFLFVDQLSVRSSARPIASPQEEMGRARRRMVADQGGDLTMRLDIYGFVLGGGK